MSRLIALGLAGLLLTAAPASAQYIGIFLNPEATSCAAEVGPNPWIDLHVVMILEGSVTEFAGAQFMIEGAPASWTPDNVLWVPDVNAVINLGHPIFPNPIHPGTPGVNLTVDCEDTSGQTRVPLGRIVLLGPPTSDNVHLRVTGFDLVPVDPDCPFVCICDFPQFSKVCVGGGEIVLNGPAPASCQLAVEEVTWANLKAMFR